MPPAPRIDLPVSASIPERYVADMETRLAIYERVAGLDSPRDVAEMEEELRDRFGEPPPLVQNLLGVALLKAVGRQAGVERISTSPESFHLRLRGGTTRGHQRAVDALGVAGARVGPEQVRIAREQAGTDWMPLIVRVLRALAGAA
ncbi:MAG: hypothetical protein F4X89_14225 [Dehalococcoidia bacterium]|nr:hypothetical protein [Dehalococcoidia bacterium]